MGNPFSKSKLVTNLSKKKGKKQPAAALVLPEFNLSRLDSNKYKTDLQIYREGFRTTKEPVSNFKGVSVLPSYNSLEEVIVHLPFSYHDDEKDETFKTTLELQHFKLYAVKFANKHGQWFRIEKDDDTKEDCVTPLNLGVEYKKLFDASRTAEDAPQSGWSKLEEVQINIAAMQSAIRCLSSQTPNQVSVPHIARSLLTLLVAVIEAIRLKSIEAYVDHEIAGGEGVVEPESRWKGETGMKSIIDGWGIMCYAVRDCVTIDKEIEEIEKNTALRTSVEEILEDKKITDQLRAKKLPLLRALRKARVFNYKMDQIKTIEAALQELGLIKKWSPDVNKKR